MIRAYLAELREGARILTGRAFWRDFRDYWSGPAVSRRIDGWVERNRRP